MTPRPNVIVRFAFLPTLLVLCYQIELANASDVIQFNRDVRPILSENCYHCHGPDESARQAGLRLDTEEGAKEWSIVEGDIEASELYARLVSDDPDLLMPPPDSERSLSKEQTDLIAKWIDGGAHYQKHWSFEKPVKPLIPSPSTASTVAEPNWGSNPIDRFVMKRLAESNAVPAERADRETLIRRLTFDLIGLPPSLEEIDAFLADNSEEATEKLIDRLIGDPRFGERMAAHWLDVARYSDTYGFQVDRDRFVWPWRDWVVKAFNTNIPYDQFVTEQLAGDLLPHATRDQILATTFSRLHPQKVEGGSVPEEFRMEYVADRTQTVGTAFLGLTMECCRCHSHKYDPITHSEYYELSAFFANVDEAGLYSYFTPSIPTPTLMLPTETEEQRLEELSSRIKQQETELADIRKAAAENTDAELQSVELSFSTPIETVDFEGNLKGPNQSVDGVVGKAVKLTGDDAVKLKKGNFKREQPFSVSLWLKTPDVKERAVVFHRSRAWTDAASRGYQLLIEDGRLSWSLIHFWPGNAIRIQATQELPVGKWIHVVVTNDGSSTASGLNLFVNGQAAKTQVIRDHLTKNITGGGGDEISIGQRFRDRGFKGGSVDQFNVFDVQLTELEIQRLANRSETPSWLETPPSDWSDRQRQLVVAHLAVRNAKNVSEAIHSLALARAEKNRLLDGMKEIMVMKEMPKARQSYRLDRGAYDARAEPVQPGTPKAVMPFDDELRKDRLGLAQWMTHPDHPLTSRVAVNRLWQLCFGVGLVRTPEDFGSQGQPPTHPELLDWLAIDFVQSGWDTKRALKQILLSSTYQLASDHPDKNIFLTDPENRLLARHNAYRLPAEMLRDQSLAMSGQLVSTQGGAPVKPYEVEASFKPTKKDKGDGLYRRSLYTYWKRTGPAPAMMALDAAKRDVCQVRRERTSSPLQAFVLLNGPQYVESSRMLAADLISSHGNDSASILRDAFRTLTSRHPSDKELTVLKELYESQLTYFSESKDAAKKYLNVGENQNLPHSDSIRLAATSVVVGTLMNFDESVMKR